MNISKSFTFGSNYEIQDIHFYLQGTPGPPGAVVTSANVGMNTQQPSFSQFYTEIKTVIYLLQFT